MGSSHFCNYGAVITLNAQGITAMTMSASQLLHYEQGMITEHTLLVLVSQSGESAEVLHIIEEISKDVTVVAVTNNSRSTLARRGDITLCLNVREEESVTTRTYLASIVAVNLVALALIGDIDPNSLETAVASALESLESYLTSHDTATQKMRDFVGQPTSLSLIGRGYSLSSVRAGALFIREVTKFPALDFDAGEFRHGPFEMIDSNFTAMVWAPEGRTVDLCTKLAWDIAERGGKVVLVTGRKQQAQHPRILTIGLPSAEELWSPLVDVSPVQLIANLLAEDRGFEVGKFRWSSKITSVE
jgi:glucosamine--fructose-6-phosphate aminotransferase (isomerizing)